MGKVLTKCMETRQTGDFYIKSLNVAPFLVQDNSNNVSIDQTDIFYCIPNEDHIDKAIEHLDEVQTGSDKDAQLLTELLLDLVALKRKYAFPRSIRQTAGPIGSLIPAHFSPKSWSSSLSATRGSEKELKPVRGYGAPKSPTRSFLRGLEKDQKRSNFMIEVRSARFLHEEMLKTHDLQQPYVIVKVYPKTGVEAENTFKTSCCEENSRPRWETFFDYPIYTKEEKKEKKLGLYCVGVSLFYSKGVSNKMWQVGEEQYFSLGSLLDQKMQTKVIDYKDPVFKGSIARLKVKLQLVHNVEEVRQRLLEDITVKIEKLIRIKDKGLVSVDQKIYNSLVNSMKGNLDIAQSVISPYSFDELKETEYYIEEPFI